MPETPLLIQVMCSPERSSALSLTQWDVLVRQGRSANLLAALAARLGAAGLLEDIPEAPRRHLHSATLAVQQQQRTIRWEVACISEALASLDAQVVLLKGAAYLAMEHPVAEGRHFSDVDILVPKAALAKTERELMIHGWIGTTLDAYDQQYYRQWMHEIPPLCHHRRHTAVDVHHSILPETARIKVRSALLFDRLQRIPGHNDRLWALDAVDRVLHSATHLFHEGELENGLRDLFDLDGLFRQFEPNDRSWSEMVPRATELGLTRPLYYALRYTAQLLGTPVPQTVMDAARSVGKPPAPIGWLMDSCYRRAFRPMHATCRITGTDSAHFALYIRSHWIRMPFFLLARHLLRKSRKKKITSEPETPSA